MLFLLSFLMVYEILRFDNAWCLLQMLHREIIIVDSFERNIDCRLRREPREHSPIPIIIQVLYYIVHLKPAQLQKPLTGQRYGSCDVSAPFFLKKT